MSFHPPPLHHCPQTPTPSNVNSHRLNLHRPSPPNQDHPPRLPDTPYCQNRPPLKTVARDRHSNSITSPIRLAPQVSQELRKHQISP